MQADHDMCVSLQQEEWEVLRAIYPDYICSDRSEEVVKLEIPIALEASHSLEVVDDGAESTSSSLGNKDTAPAISALPPLSLQLTFAPAYPLHAPPTIVSLESMGDWFSCTEALKRLLLDSWHPGEGVLFDWVELIRTGDFLRSLGLTSGDNIRIPHPTPHTVVPLLASHDLKVKSDNFSQSTYPCAICLAERKGDHCVQLDCTHIFCRSCLEEYWGLLVSEGDADRVGCPDSGCIKDGREASEEEARRVLTGAQVERLIWLREKRELEKDPAVIYCPFEACRAAVPKPPEQGEESGWVRLRTCRCCGNSFCSVCRRTWHGPISPCVISVMETLVLDYLSSSEGSAERLALENQYGRTTVQRLVKNYEEERLNRRWLDLSTTTCPQCKINVQKSQGCNHITCAKCGEHFCYRCGEKLDAIHPLDHYNKRGHPCWDKIYDHVPGEWEMDVL